MAGGKSRNVPKRDPSDARFTNTLENASSMMSQNTTPKTMLNTPTLSNFVSKANSIMTGLTGNLRQNTTIATGILDITLDSSGGAIPPRQIIVVDPEGAGTTDTLDAIEMNGGEPEGSVITLLGVNGNTITITHNFTPAGTERAILCPGDTDFTFSNDDALDLVYDKINSVWILKTSGTGTSTGATFPLAYTVDDQGSKTGTVTHSLTLGTAHKLQFTATGDCDITLTGFGSGNAPAIDFYIEATQDGTGGHAITFNDAEVINPPTISTEPNTTSLLACHADGDGNIRIIILLNAAAGPVTGATKALDNLVSPTLNADIDVNSKNLTGIDEATFTSVGGTTAADYSIAVNAPDTKLLFNVPTGKEYDFLVNNVAAWNMSSTSLTGANLILSDTLVLNDSSADPLATGIFSKNGADVKVHSGGSVRNLSDIISSLTTKGDLLGYSTATTRIPVGADGQSLLADSSDAEGVSWSTLNTISQLNSNVTVTDSGSGVIVNTVDGGTVFSMQASRLDVEQLPMFGLSALSFYDTTDAATATSMTQNQTDFTINVPVNSDTYKLNFNGTVGLSVDLLKTRLYSNTPNTTHAELSLFRDDATSPTTNDVLGRLSFDGNDSVGGIETYAEIDGEIRVSTSGSEEGQLVFRLVDGGADVETVRMKPGELELNRLASGATDNVLLSIIKEDATPTDNDELGKIDFRLFDSPIEIIYAQIASEIRDVTDAGRLKLNVRANNTAAMHTALEVEGDDTASNSYMKIHSRVAQDLLFGVETGSTDLVIKPTVNQLGYQVGTGTLTVGSVGSIQLPFTTSAPGTKAGADTAFGNLVGCIGVHDPDTGANPIIYVKQNNGNWAALTMTVNSLV